MAELIGARRGAYAALAGGLALLTALVVYHGAGEVLAALAAAGYGLLLVALFHLGPLFADALGWRRLVGNRVSRLAFMRLRWIGESINSLLPVFQLGGNVVKAQLLARRGVPQPVAAASVVVDVTLVAASQLLFTLFGLLLLIEHLGGGGLVAPSLAGVAIMGFLVAAFFAVQRRGLFAGLARSIGRFGGDRRWAQLTSSAEALDETVAQIYRDRGALIAAVSWHLMSWILGAGEVWLALRFIGHPVDLQTALLLESLGQAVRVAAFAIPGAMGVQEGGYLVLGRAVGLAPETCLALSLSKRVREIALGIPGLIAWQWEGVLARDGA